LNRLLPQDFPLASPGHGRQNPAPAAPVGGLPQPDAHAPMNIPLRRPQHPLGIAAIAIHEPPWRLANDWFAGSMPRKFAHHTGIEARSISLEDETAMGMQAVRQLECDTGCRLADCRGLVFVSPSFIPPSVARRYLPPAQAEAERPSRAARQIARDLGLAHCRTIGINWFCCGYARALMLAHHRWAPRLGLARDEFVVVVVASRISRITDYGCSQTAGLFGDMASATLLTGTANRRHPVHFEILHAAASKQPAARPAFDFHVGRDVPVPTPEGGTTHEAGRLVYSLDGMAIAEIAPRAMAAAVGAALDAGRLAPADIRFVVPHQAGTGIVRFTGMQLEQLGVRGELVNGLTRQTGNTSACSIPHALVQTWSQLEGVVACPSAAVGSPGKPEVLQGCVLLRSTAAHERLGSVAA
jgi:3-oxoacyl-[acyl-carrier-protein] synthase III